MLLLESLLGNTNEIVRTYLWQLQQISRARVTDVADVLPRTIIERLPTPDMEKQLDQCIPVSDDPISQVAAPMGESNAEEACTAQCSHYQEEESEQLPEPGEDVSFPVLATPDQKTQKKKNKKKKPGSKRNRQQGGPGGRPWWLPDGVPVEAQKYWLQRYSLFSRYDDGIQLDMEGWFSVTPEVVAAHQARVAPESGVALDPFAGAGGNVVALAQRCCHVLALELHPSRATLLQHNARIYGVEDRVDIVTGDFFKLARGLKVE